MNITAESPLKLRGKIILEFVDSRDGTTRVIEKDNLITNFAYIGNIGLLYTASPSLGIQSLWNRGLRIFLSSNTTAASRTVSSTSSLPTIHISAATTSQTFNATALPYFYQNYYQFPAPGGGGRTFQTVGLTDQANLNSGSNPANVYAYTVLDSPCVQGPFEFLNAYYVLQPGTESTRDANIPGDKTLKANAAFFVLTGNTGVVGPYGYSNRWVSTLLSESVTGYPDKTIYPYTNPRSARNVNVTAFAGLGSSFNSPIIAGFLADSSKFASVYNINAPTTRLVGKILHGYQQGAELFFNFTPFSFGNFGFAETNGGLQGLFTHNPSAPGPFFDGSHAANGTGAVTVAGTWASGKWPQIYGTNITTTGPVGTSTYQFWTAPTTGFCSNSYYQRAPLCTYINNQTPAFDGAHGQNLSTSTRIIKYDETSVVTWDATGVTLLNISNGQYKFWDQFSSPAFTVSNITQCCTDGKATSISEYSASTLIYVADKTSGLFVIDPVANTITNLIATPCYAVAMGTGGNVVAILSTGVVYGSGVTFTSPVPLTISSTIINYNTIAYLKTDKASSTYQSAVVFSNHTFYWFNDTTAGVLTYGDTFDSSSASPSRITGAIEVSDYGSYWVAQMGNVASSGCFTFTPQTTTRYSLITGSISNIPNVCFFGDKLLAYGLGVSTVSADSGTYYDQEPAFGSYGIFQANLINPSNGAVYGQTTYDLPNMSTRYGTFWNKSFTLHMSQGLILAGAQDTTIEPYYSGFAPKVNYECHIAAPSLTTNLWKKLYKWDTATSLWGTGYSDSKPTHASADSLIDGLTIAFTNGSTGTSFVVDDYYTITACHGLMKDNATTFTAESKAYLKPTYYNVALEGGLTVGASPTSPAITSNPDFITFLNDYANNFSINIGGSPALVLLTGSPAAGQVTVGTNTLTFNAADIGASISGTVSYLLHV